jgi:adenine phosphoribosyltransferase
LQAVAQAINATAMSDRLRTLIRDVPNFPKPGILFKDITPILGDAKALVEVMDALAKPWLGQGITRVIGIESRGFILAPSVAVHLGAGFVPLRKPGKLPWKAIRQGYGLEYGTDVIEMHEDSVSSADRVLIVDDVLATGGTAGAAITLATRAGATVVGCAFMIDLTFLGGAAKLGVPVTSVLTY